MAFSDRSQRGSPASAPGAGKAGGSGQADAAGRTVLQRELRITGSILTDGEIEFHGEVDGVVCAKGVTIGSGARFKGEIIAENATIAGHAAGRITARKIRLAEGSEFEGDLIYQRLAIEEGAEFDGNVMRKKEDSAWVDITKTFEIPGVELTPDAARAVQALREEAKDLAVETSSG
ncbi:MAG: polymer-forming cytoskeletal protein [Rhodobacteraceae bacterium]|nr:polymer-forming cytoskeletal protein [Paracoccaceae bacterium]